MRNDIYVLLFRLGFVIWTKVHEVDRVLDDTCGLDEQITSDPHIYLDLQNGGVATETDSNNKPI